MTMAIVVKPQDPRCTPRPGRSRRGDASCVKSSPVPNRTRLASVARSGRPMMLEAPLRERALVVGVRRDAARVADDEWRRRLVREDAQPCAAEAALDVHVLALDPAVHVTTRDIRASFHRVLLSRAQLTMSAVTMPNIPVDASAWPRMWQWKAHAPGASATTMASHRSPGAMLSVSHLNGCGSGYPSRAKTSNGIPCRCIGGICVPALRKRNRTRCPPFAMDC